MFTSLTLFGHHRRSGRSHSVYNSIADCCHSLYDEDGGHILHWPLTSTSHLFPHNSRRLVSPLQSGSNSHSESSLAPILTLRVNFTKSPSSNHAQFCRANGPSIISAATDGLTYKEAVAESWLGQKDIKRSQWHIFYRFHHVSSLKLWQKILFISCQWHWIFQYLLFRDIRYLLNCNFCWIFIPFCIWHSVLIGWISEVKTCILSLSA